MPCAKSQDAPTIGLQLLRILSGRGKRLVVALDVVQAFLDESGTNPETPVLSVAGSYGTEHQWLEFRRLWESHSQGFHAKNSSRRFPLLVDAISAGRISSLLVSVGKDTYKQHASAHFKTALGNAYASCALMCVAEICSQNAPQTCSFVLEAGQPNLVFIKGIVEDMMNWNASGLGPADWRIAHVGSATKKDSLELHCADFVSHLSSSYDKPWMGKLFDLGLLKHVHITKHHLEGIAPAVTDLFRQLRILRKALKPN